MLLLNVKDVVDRDTDINFRRAASQIEVLKECDDTMTPYAILSHRWQDEVDYNEMINLMEMEKGKREDIMGRNGYKKILRSCEQAKKDGLEWLWVDTCCIDKRSSSALSEAINSMYRWYENSTKCYAYLHDIDGPTFPIAENLERYGNHKGWPEWFSRGWTLQELIAPRDVQFFNKEWVPIGNKRDLADTLEKITRISKDILISGLDSGVRSVAQIMSWAADRETTRVEDRAYSLLGLFRVHMPMVYGEGKKAFLRLQLEIIRSSNDHSIFAWDPEGRIRRCGSILADDPNYFRDCDGIWKMEPEWFVQRLKSHTRDHSPGIVRQVTPANLIKSTVLAVRSRALIRELSTCSVTSGGLQISLPIVPYPGSPGSPSLFRATLGCVASLVGPLMTIDLSSDSTSTRYYRFFGATEQPTTFPRVKPLFLSYYQDESRNLTLDDRTVSFYGFTRCGTFPSNIVRDSVKLLLTTDLIVVIYANDKAYAHDKAYGNSKVYGNDKAAVRFAVGFGYYLGSAWTHVAYDENRDTEWQEYARKAYDSMRDRQRDLVGNMPDHDVATYTGSDTASFTRHAHLPRSIWAARIMWGVWYRGNCKVTIDIVLCSGCCHGPLACETSTTDWKGFETPGPMQEAGPSSPKYGLHMDGVRMQLLYFPNIEIELGDYGYCNSTFERVGNIFQDRAAHPAYEPVRRKVSSETMAEDTVTVWASGGGYSKFDLRQPDGLSLPNNQQLVSLLKELSPRLVDKCLVTSVVRVRTQRGSTNTPLFYLSTPQVWRRDAIDERRRTQFREIREQFYTLLNWSRPTTSTGGSQSPNAKATKEATKYFSDLFGIEHFESYVGKITFFDKLFTGLELSLDSETLEVVHDCSINLLAKMLRGRMVRANPISRERMRGVKREIAAISKTLGVRLLQEMKAGYIQTYDVLYPLKGKLSKSCMDYDLSKPITEYIGSLPQPVTVSGHGGIRDKVQVIKTLQTKLDATEDIDEQLALEEDITGRILWTCHSGLRSVVGHIPAKVLHNILENDEVYDLMDRVKFLDEISTVFDDALAELPTDDQAHLRRIMADADAGISKHELLLAERTRKRRAPGATSEGQTTT